jgi:uncharacterized protein with PIN domain
MKFICDDNLGKLAKSLRILGFDTLHDDNYTDQVLMKTASADRRHLLTRDRKLSLKTHPHGITIVLHDDPLEQLTSVIMTLSLQIDTRRLFDRCSICNTICELVDKNSISENIFPYIIKTQDTIKKCPSCGRFYWKGSHYKDILVNLRTAIPEMNLYGKWPE